MDRRRFLDLAVFGGALGSLSAILYPVLRFLIPPEDAEPEPDSLKAGKAADFPAGTGKILKFGRKPVLLVRDGKGVFHALSATCTHLDCLVQYRSEQDLIWCACHNGKYDLSGKNLSGPPPRPLDKYEVKLAGEEVLIVRSG